MVAMVVALCGAARAGKDTAAAILHESGGHVNLKLARPLKDAVRLLFDLSEDSVDGAAKDEVHADWGVTPRVLMQWLGTEVMQHSLQDVLPSCGRQFWVDRLIRTIDDMPADANVVVSDVRFHHEVDALRRRYGDRLMSIKLTRSRAAELAASTHESETSPDGLLTDVTIHNDGTLRQLRSAVLSAVLRHNVLQYKRFDVPHEGEHQDGVRDP